MIKVFGHKSPDTDSVCSAIALAHLQNNLNASAKPFCLGELNNETKYALSYFGVKTPDILEYADENDTVYLVDHNEFAQSVNGIEKANIVGIIDHHKVDGFKTMAPIYIRIEPIGCTATIIYQMYKENAIEIPREISGLLLSAIISDSLLFKSPTFTARDKEVADELVKALGIDVEQYGLEMLKEGANIDDKSALELLHLDSKPFTMGKYATQVAQVNVIELEAIRQRKSEIIACMAQVAQERGIDLFFFVATDIMNSNSLAYFYSKKSDIPELIGKSFDVKVAESELFLPNVVSRKKQIVPQMTSVFKQF